MSEKPTLSIIETPQKIEVNEKEKNILEVGCGVVPFFIVPTEDEIINLGTAHYVGLDIKEERTIPVADYLKQKNLQTKFDFVTGEGDKLPFADKVFNEVIFNNIFGDDTLLYHKYGYESALFNKETELMKRAFIDEVFRVLKKDGKLIIIETYTPEIAQDFFKDINFNQDERFYSVNAEKYQDDIKRHFGGKWKEKKDSFVKVFEKR